ncbi:MAG: RagB/SusD family nutrient uptake outer membrane protein, partial [Pedobacter sp.]
MLNFKMTIMKTQNIHHQYTPVSAPLLFAGKTTVGLCMMLFFFLISACKKDLNLVPEDNISDATFYKTAADYKLAANLLYQGLDQWGTEDTQSDIAFNNPNSVSNGQLLPSETTAWTGLYTNIRYANNIIEKGAASTDTQIKRFVAEARFFRAYYYYKLFRLYGGVPLISKVLQTGDEALFAPRATMVQTADFILADLSAAKADLPVQSALASGDVGRITKGIASGFAARVALFEGTWLKFRGEAAANTYLDAAIAASQEVISSGLYALYTGNGAQSYRYLFLEAGDDSKETMLDRRYARNIFGHDVPYAYDQDGYNPTRKMADLYLDKNGLPITSPGTVFQGYQTFVSEFQDRDPRMTMTMIIPGTLTNRVFFPVTKVANWPDNPQRNFNTGYILYKYMSEDAAAN